MKERRVAITGSNGVIGTVLRRELSDYAITPLDLPSVDVCDYQRLLEVMPNHEVIVHLAWDSKIDNWKSGRIDTHNTLMTENVYRVAIEVGVGRVIMASSVHANGYSDWKGPKRISPYDLPNPDSAYGSHKVFMEALGRYYATEGLEVICIRFGGINPENKPSEDGPERLVYLSHRDCGSLLRACIDTKLIPDNFVIIYGISNNTGRRHDIANPLGWRPLDNTNSTLIPALHSTKV